MNVLDEIEEQSALRARAATLGVKVRLCPCELCGRTSQLCTGVLADLQADIVEAERASGGEEKMNIQDIQTKEQAVMFVSAVICTPLALKSPRFADALDVSRRFDVSVVDVLECRKLRAEKT